ncbi:MAG: hypothetical protein AB8B55_12860 [Mariniblastus sp.]
MAELTQRTVGYFETIKAIGSVWIERLKEATFDVNRIRLTGGINSVG